MKPVITILILIVCINLNAQKRMKDFEFENACLTDTFWVDINKCAYSEYEDAYNDMYKYQKMGKLKTCLITEDVLGYYITCLAVRNPIFTNYRYWLRHDKLSKRINKKGLIFIY
jgi:hypothetical protein